MSHTQMSVYGSTLAEGNAEATDEEGSTVCEPCQTLLISALDGWDDPYSSRSASLPDHCVSDTSPCHICRLFYAFLSIQSSPRDPLLSLDLKSGHAYQALIKSEDPISRPTVYLHKSGPGTTIWAWQPLIEVSQSADVSSHRHQRTYPQNVDLAMTVQTLKVCEESHGPECQPQDISGLFDLRVIDCDTCEVVKADGSCQFMALSYVWGRSEINATNIDAPQWEHLPLTIQQSIMVTKKLGYHFLWVDRFCIDQNDNRQKHTQIAQMGHIYAAAQVTIVAAAGSDPEYGLPGVAPGSRQPLLRARFGRISLTLLPPARGVHDVLDSRWASRGWTFQETVFSRRRFIFTERQIIFLCNTGCAYEAETAGLIQDQDGWAVEGLRPDNSLNKTALEEAVAYLKGFSTRDLSYDTDALDAILGALHTIGTIHQIWGVPFQLKDAPTRHGQLLRGGTYSIALLWYHYEPARRRHGFPSWSSIGWAGGIGEHDPVDSSTLLDISVTHATAGKRPLQHLPTIAADFLEYKVIDQRLEVVVLAADARLVPASDIEKPEYNSSLKLSSWNIMLPWTHNLYLCYDIWWDADPATFAYESWIKCISLRGRRYLSIRQPEFILVMSKGDYYERVALVRPDPWFCTDSTGDLELVPHHELSAEEQSMLANDTWQLDFKIETIRLG